MEIVNKKSILILGVLAGLAIVLLVISSVISSFSSSDDPNEYEKKEKKENVVYTVITDDAKTILNKVYNPVHDYYTGFMNESGEYENIFGNPNQLLTTNLSIKTKMTLVLNTINYKNMQTVTCNKVSFNDKSICGSKNKRVAYALKVQDFNDKFFDIFGYDVDYTTLDTDNLVIGSCSGTNSYAFKYSEKDGLFVSLYSKKCPVNGYIKVYNVTKKQVNELLTLDVYYEKRILNSRTKKVFKVLKKHDQFFFNVQENGSYYLFSTTMI